VVIPYADTTNLTAIENWLAERFGPMVQKEGQAYVGHTGSFSGASTLGKSRNSPHLTIVSGADSPTPPWVWAAQSAARDSFEPDPARPRQTLALPGCLPPKDKAQLTREERNMLLYDGVSTYTVNPGNVAAIERLITTYKTNEVGVPDTAYLDIETMRTIAYLRFTVRTRIGTKYPRHKLADDGTLYGPGQAIVTPSVIRSELLALFREWELAGLVEGYEQFKTDLIVERNASDPNRVDAVIPPDVVNQFRVFAGQVQFRL
jgi:phage tail sheath gpL-like